MSKHINAKTFQEAFYEINRLVFTKPDFEFNSRIGDCKEATCISYTVQDPTSYMFENKAINRIPYHYAETFYDFMLSGRTNAEEAFKDYAAVLPFVQKPKHQDIPDNFNSLYGPRIKRQLPAIIKELQENPSTRRACLLILNEEDHILLDKDETIEYPCTLSVTYFIRDGALHGQCDMRSQNTAVVMQLDMFLQGKLLIHLADELGLQYGTFSSTMVSGHIYQRDFDYVEDLVTKYVEDWNNRTDSL